MQAYSVYAIPPLGVLRIAVEVLLVSLNKHTIELYADAIVSAAARRLI